MSLIYRVVLMKNEKICVQCFLNSFYLKNITFFHYRVYNWKCLISHYHIDKHSLQWIFSFLFFLNWCSSCIGEGNSNPLQCSCLENPRDGGAWWAAIYGVAQSRTRLQRLSSSSRVDLQFCISFNLTPKWSSYIYALYALFFRLFSIIGYHCWDLTNAMIGFRD